MRVLIVEDDTSLNQSLVAEFEAKGFKVLSATDGKEGQYLGTEYPNDLAIIDLGLPEVSGIELIKAIRAASKDYPILVLTALVSGVAHAGETPPGPRLSSVCAAR